MKKSILFFMALNFWSISQGKGAPSIFNTVNGYVTAGWDVHVLMRESSPNFGSSPLNLHIHSFNFPVLSRLSAIRHLSTPFRLLLWFVTNIKFRLFGSRIIRRENIGVLYAYEAEGVPAARALARRHRLPLVTRFMGTVLADKLMSLKYRIVLFYHFLALKTRADLVIMTNDGTRGRWVLEQLGNRSPDIRFWMNGVNHVDLDGYDERRIGEMIGVPAGCKTLLCVSRLVSWKRLDRSVHAFKAVLDAYPDDIRLVIVGDGEMKPELMGLAERLGIGEKVVFAGGMPQADVYHVMKFCDIFLSLYDLSNMGNPLFEAMRCGKPIITLGNGDTASIISTNVNGIVLADDDMATVKDAILRLLGDETFSARLAANAAQYARDHFRTWDERIREETLLVESLVIQKSRKSTHIDTIT